MPVTLAPVAAYTIAVLAPAGPDDGCPSPRQVNEALVAHLGGTVAPFGQPQTASTLRLTVTSDGTGALRLDLNDPAGGPLLHRVLPPREHARDCPALAETAALIVDRYWHEVGYDVPLAAPRAPPAPTPTTPPPANEPTPPTRPSLPAEERRATPEISGPAEPRPETSAPAPPPRARAAEVIPPPGWYLGAAAAVDVADSDATAFSAELFSAAFTGGFETAAGSGRLGFRFSAGARNRVMARWSTGQARFLQLPARVGGYWPLRTRLGQLEPGVGLDLDTVVVSVTDGGSRNLVRASPAADLALGWSVWFSRGIYLRAMAEAVEGVPYRFVTLAGDMSVWRTPRTSLDLELESGVWFQ